jgi:hypothetical protein
MQTIHYSYSISAALQPSICIFVICRSLHLSRVRFFKYYNYSHSVCGYTPAAA